MLFKNLYDSTISNILMLHLRCGLQVDSCLFTTLCCNIFFILSRSKALKYIMSRIKIPGKLPFLKFPLHYKGAPQRRLFFPDWYVKILKPDEENIPKNYVKLSVPADMTKYDVKEYLEKIYDVPVSKISLNLVEYTHYRDEDGKHKWIKPWKIAHVHLGKGLTFNFPDIIEATKSVNEFEQQQTDQYQSQLKQLSDNESEDIDIKKPVGNKWFLQ